LQLSNTKDETTQNETTQFQIRCAKVQITGPSEWRLFISQLQTTQKNEETPSSSSSTTGWAIG